ncbi:MAG TPA: hypothetical protein VMG10_27940 [Gemmataceae bacterium]|nr:hypothetical protein [Gemmataceae bacterium]
MAECPFCKEKVGANDFLPSEEAVCPACGNRPPSSPPPEPWWVSAASLEPIEPKAAPPDGSWTPPAAPETKKPVVAQMAPPKPTAAPKPNPPESVPAAAPAPLSPPSSSPPPPRMVPSPPRLPFRTVSADDDDDEEEPPSLLDRLRSLDFGSALALLCFSVALLFRSFDALEPFVKPIATLGLLAGLLGGTLPALWRRTKAVVPSLLSMLCLVVLLFVGSWPGFSSPPPPLVTVPLNKKGMAAHQAAGADDWVDASANAVKRGDVRMEIVSVQIGPVDLKRNSSASPSAERYLTIRLRASYEGVVFHQTPYEPWSDRAEAPSKHSPTLTDNQGHTYAQKTFDPGWKVVGRADLDALNPGHQVKDVLVYPVPAGEVEYLRLTLPASAFGLDGDFRLQIPRSMIRGLVKGGGP